jgi:hypothetical protein
MKKRTVITTEKREVWIISEGGVRQEISNSEADVSGYASEPAPPTVPTAADTLPEKERKEKNE